MKTWRFIPLLALLFSPLAVNSAQAAPLRWSELDLKYAREQGRVDCQLRVAKCYYKGVGVKKDLSAAIYWYRKAAEQGNAEAQLFIGSRYSKGEGVKQSDAKAVWWWRKAAAKNNVTALYNMGWAYKGGRGVTPNYAEALKWWKKAAKRNFKPAQDKLRALGEKW